MAKWLSMAALTEAITGVYIGGLKSGAKREF